MARRTFQVIDVVEVLQHWHAGRPKAVVAASLGVDVKTVRKYVAAAEADGIRPGDDPQPGPGGLGVRAGRLVPGSGGRAGSTAHLDGPFLGGRPSTAWELRSVAA